MLNREQVEAIVHNPMNADWGHVLQLADDWLDMQDAIRESNVLAFRNAANMVSAIDNDRAHHARHDEHKAALERRINEGLREVAGLRARLAALEH